MPEHKRITDTSDIIIRILRSNRRSVVGRVLPDSSIEVRAPLSMTNERINEWLDRYEPKFRPMIDECRRVNSYVAEHPFGYGGEILYKGEWIPISDAVGNNNGYVVQIKDGAIVAMPGLSETTMRQHIEILFSSLAKPVFEAKLHHYSALMKVRCKTWTIGNARKRHGSCDSNGKIILSWRIIMMSESIVEYIVVHELAHLKHMNHGKGFHSEVASVLPNWKERRIAHNEYSKILRCGSWM